MGVIEDIVMSPNMQPNVWRAILTWVRPGIKLQSFLSVPGGCVVSDVKKVCHSPNQQDRQRTGEEALPLRHRASGGSEVHPTSQPAVDVGGMDGLSQKTCDTVTGLLYGCQIVILR